MMIAMIVRIIGDGGAGDDDGGDDHGDDKKKGEHVTNCGK